MRDQPARLVTEQRLDHAVTREALRRALEEHPLPLRELVELALTVALSRAQGNISGAARALGLSRSSMHRRLARARRQTVPSIEPTPLDEAAHPPE